MLEKPLVLQEMESREPATRYRGPAGVSVLTLASPEWRDTDVGLLALKDFRVSLKTLRIYLPAIDFHTK